MSCSLCQRSHSDNEAWTDSMQHCTWKALEETLGTPSVLYKKLKFLSHTQSTNNSCKHLYYKVDSVYWRWQCALVADEIDAFWYSYISDSKKVRNTFNVFLSSASLIFVNVCLFWTWWQQHVSNKFRNNRSRWIIDTFMPLHYFLKDQGPFHHKNKWSHLWIVF